MNRPSDVLLRKMLMLGEEQLAEVEQFVESLQRGDRLLTHASTAISEPAFQAVWNNPEDDVYDGLSIRQ